MGLHQRYEAISAKDRLKVHTMIALSHDYLSKRASSFQIR